MGTRFMEFPQTPRGRGFSLLEFYSYFLSVLSMFESNEAVRGRLIGPKPWDRIDINFETKMEQSYMGTGCLGVVCVNLCIKCFLGMHWVGNGRGLQVH